mmetsp:Transcript_106794/g.297264  ORF Transcript_106794/g.297264 Transcript_106794/m.297264 type:complete len:234 (+) Transcript_106794:906-1607(+)
MLEVPRQGENLFAHHLLVAFVGWQLMESQWCAINQDMLTPWAHPVQAGATVPHEARPLCSRNALLLNQLTRKCFKGLKLLSCYLSKRCCHKHPLRSGGQPQAEVLHAEVHIILHEHIHLVKNHSSTLTKIQWTRRIFEQQPPQASWCCNQHIGPSCELPPLCVCATDSSAAMDTELACTSGGHHPCHIQDLLCEVRCWREHQQLYATGQLRCTLPGTKDVALQERQKIGKCLA